MSSKYHSLKKKNVMNEFFGHLAADGLAGDCWRLSLL